MEHHTEEDEDEDEQGETFEFDDGDDIGPTELSSGSDSTTDTAASNLYTKTNTAQQTSRQDLNRTTSTWQEGQNSSMYHPYCSGELACTQ